MYINISCIFYSIYGYMVKKKKCCPTFSTKFFLLKKVIFYISKFEIRILQINITFYNVCQGVRENSKLLYMFNNKKLSISQEISYFI